MRLFARSDSLVGPGRGLEAQSRDRAKEEPRRRRAEQENNHTEMMKPH